jgi:hypothetical protein
MVTNARAWERDVEKLERAGKSGRYQEGQAESHEKRWDAKGEEKMQKERQMRGRGLDAKKPVEWGGFKNGRVG